MSAMSGEAVTEAVPAATEGTDQEEEDQGVVDLMQWIGLGYSETETLIAEGFEIERIYGSAMRPTVETNGTVAGSITLHNVFEVTCAGGGPHAYGYYIEFFNPVETEFDRQRVFMWTMQGVVLCVDKIATFINTDSNGECIVLRQANEAGDDVADGVELLEDECMTFYDGEVWSPTDDEEDEEEESSEDEEEESSEDEEEESSNFKEQKIAEAEQRLKDNVARMQAELGNLDAEDLAASAVGAAGRQSCAICLKEVDALWILRCGHILGCLDCTKMAIEHDDKCAICRQPVHPDDPQPVSQQIVDANRFVQETAALDTHLSA
eukprot:gene8797-32693_t